MIVPSQTEIETMWTSGRHREVARWLPHFHRGNHSILIENLKKSNLTQLGDKLDQQPITLGADPEFILCEKGKPDNIVMFSSQYTGDRFGISEAVIGADYGLLEFRVPYAVSPLTIVGSVMGLHGDFEKCFPDLDIIKKEALVYNHEIARLRDQLELKSQGKEMPNYGGYHSKDLSVWSASPGGEGDIVLDDTSNASFSAYGRPEFKKYRPEVLSAGGHIHIGGTFIKALSMEQLNKLIRQFDETVLPLAAKVETEAAELRKEVYGSRGEYRLKEYGIEYRSPSNAIFFPENSHILLEVLNLIVNQVKSFLLEK